MPRLYTRSRRRGSGEDEVPPPQGQTLLRVGPFSMQNRVGQGPGSDTGAPIYRFALLNAFATSDLHADIATADAQDIQLMLILTGAPNQYGANTATGFSMSAYTGLLDDWVGDAVLADAIARQRALLYIGDEPQHSKWDNSSGDNTWTPVLFNQCAREHKIRWPGCLTFARVKPSQLRAGWDGNDPPPGGWDALDYGWAQYEGQHHRSGLTPVQYIAQERADAAIIDVGVAHSFNLWAGGLRDDMDGVDDCWDYQNTGSSYGLIKGTPSQNGVTEGSFLTCAQADALGNQLLNTVASPAWITRWIDTVYDDPDLPFAALWTIPSEGAGVGWAIPLIDRPDFVSVLDYAVTKGLTRPAWNGLRSPKP